MKHYTKNKKSVLYVSEKIKDSINDMIGIPYIKLNGNRQMMIEGKCTIDRFESSSVSLICERIKIQVSGEKLEICILDSSAVVIEGKILSFDFGEDAL